MSPKLKRIFSSLKHRRSLWLEFFFLDLFSPEDASFVKLKTTLDSEVTVSSGVQGQVLLLKTNRLQVVSTMPRNLKVLKFVLIKVVGHIEELKLIMFCDNWKMMKQELFTRGMLVLCNLI